MSLPLRCLIRSLAAVVTVVAIVFPTAAAYAVRSVPPDIAGHWSAAEVCRLLAQQVARTDSDGLFRPDQPVTRGEVVRMLVLALGRGSDAQALSRSPRTFGDVGIMHPERGFIEAAAEFGLARGYPNGTFAPDELVSRAELSAFLVRAVGLELQAASSRGELPFLDADTIPAWARGYVGVIQRYGLVTGFDDNRFYAAAPATRAQLAVIICRLMERQGTAWSLVGTVRTVGPRGHIRIQPEKASLSVLLPLDDAPYLFRNGRPCSINDIQIGDQILIVLGARDQVVFCSAHWEDEVAELSSVASDRQSVNVVARSGTRHLGVLPDAVIVRGGRSASLSELRPGDRVYLVYDVLTGKARAIDAVRVDDRGVLMMIRPTERSFTFLSSSGAPRTLRLAAGAIVLLDGRTSFLQELRVGDLATAVTVVQDQVTYLEVRRHD